MISILGLLILIFGAAVIGYGLTLLQHKLAVKTQVNTIASDILELLPQTQCAQCSYPGCAPYAEAVANGEAHNKCPPGGEHLVQQLSELLNRPALPLENQDKVASTPLVALIREEDCIGCAKCIPACPVDAIVGAANMMHTVIIKDCTGCELCLPPCPVDCIDLVTLDDLAPLNNLTSAHS